MEEEQKLELISLAIKRLLEDEKNKESSDRSSVGGDENDDRNLLCNLLSQIVSLKVGTEAEEVASAVVDSLETRSENAIEEIESLKVGTDAEEVASAVVDSLESRSENAIEEETVDVDCREEIVRELKKVKRQNVVTHCLLSVMIVLTVVWQISEVSIILKVKDKVSHPFRSLGRMLTGVLQRPKTIVENTEKSSSKQNDDEASVLPPLKIPEFARVKFPEMGFDSGKH